MNKSDIKFWAAAVVIIVIALTNLTLNRRIQEQVQIIAAKQDKDEDIMLQALYHAISRWEQLQELNPELKVPKANLPGELLPQLLPTPSPTPEGKP
jgi:hypothetical protein